jgi:hypothetical protein
MRTSCICWLVSVVLLITTAPAQSSTGDIIHVTSHNRTKAVTDPTKGSNAYPKWAIFPARNIEYRKVVLYVTYQCPDGQHCGEWDYLDGIYLRRLGGVAAPSHDIEIGRMISPYGSRFDSTWTFTWHVDVTDYSLLLHDSVEVEFLHGGYESNTDRGWLITLDFAITEGHPAMQCLGFDSLWHGSIPFGDSARPIEEVLAPRSFTVPSGATIARFRIAQTGHGMDDLENCAEFCNKYRRVLLDDSLVNQRQLWRECGSNPLYPQAGTWLFDRANWCPGAIVYPDIYDLPVEAGSTHKIDLEMEPYINRSKPSASYYLYSQIFFYAAPAASNDASIEEIISPSALDEYSRVNPTCANPVIVIKNNGREDLHSLTIGFGHGLPPQQTYQWSGNLLPQELDTVELPGPIAPRSENTFVARLESPNGEVDEYPADNTMASAVPASPVYGTTLLLAIHTNADTSQTGYRITGADGAVAYERRPGTMTVNTTYLDTLRLTPGCYQLVVSDSARDGLDFWFNPEGGYGYARLLDLNGRLLKPFLSDFGSEIRHSFQVVAGAQPPAALDELPIVNPFPTRNKGEFTIDIFLEKRSDLRVKIVDESGVETILDNIYTGIKTTMLPIDIRFARDGVYYVKVTADGKTVSRRIRVKRTE